MNVRLHIERLVTDGTERVDPPAIAAAAAEALAAAAPPPRAGARDHVRVAVQARGAEEAVARALAAALVDAQVTER